MASTMTSSFKRGVRELTQGFERPPANAGGLCNGCGTGARDCLNFGSFRTKKKGKPLKDLPLVGMPGFEPGASWSRTKRDTKLRHIPIAHLL